MINRKLIEKSSYGYYVPFDASLSKHLENMPDNFDLNITDNCGIQENKG